MVVGVQMMVAHEAAVARVRREVVVLVLVMAIDIHSIVD